jgi:hypothetical protein
MRRLYFHEAHSGAVNDDELLARQAEPQSEAERFVRGLGLVEILGRGRPPMLGG